MNLFFKCLFILFFLSPCNASAPARIARDLLVKTIDIKPAPQRLDELDRELSSFMQDIYPDNVDEFMDGTIIRKVLGDRVNDPPLDDLNFRAAFYSSAIKSLPSERFSRDPYFYIVGNFIVGLHNSFPSKISEMVRIISSPYFHLPPNRVDELNNIRQTVFDYIGKNLDHIHAEGYSRKIFDKWWRDEDFRATVFNSIEKVHLDDPDIMLKWWKENKSREAGRFETFVLPYLEKIHNNGGKVTENDAFWTTCMQVSKNSEEFVQEISFLFNQMIGPIESFTPGMIKALQPEQLRVIHPEELQKLSVRQINAFTPEQLRVFNPQQRRALLRVYTNDSLIERMENF